MLVGSMAFLAALALAGVVGAAALAQHWQQGAAAALTVQVPDAGTDGRLTAVLSALRATSGVADARALDDSELDALLRPWLGGSTGMGRSTGRIALPLPAVIAVRLDGADFNEPAVAARLATIAPGVMVESQDRWLHRLTSLARSLQACAALAMAVVGFVAVAVVGVATRAGLAARRDAIEIVHGLGAADGFIAGSFARRAMRLTAAGGLVGALLALPVLLGLTGLAAPFGGGDAPADISALAAAMPASLWFSLPVLPAVAAAIGWLTAQITVRRWLRRLP